MADFRRYSDLYNADPMMDVFRAPFRLERAASTPQVAPPDAPPDAIPEGNDEDTAGLMSKAIDWGVSGLGAVGNLLDLPGSSVRDVLGGKNPFDQWLHPWSHREKGLSLEGRELLHRRGLAGKNQETGISGWWDDPYEGVQDIAGFAVELATDPFAWWAGFTGGARAAAKAAQAAKRAKVVEAAKAAGNPIPPVSSANKFWSGVDKVGSVIDKFDPGYHVGRIADLHAGPKIRGLAGKVDSKTGKVVRDELTGRIKDPGVLTRVSRKVEDASVKFRRWRDKHDVDMPKDPVAIQDLENELDVVRIKEGIDPEARLITSLSPGQEVSRRIGKAFGVDVYFYGGGRTSGRRAGFAFVDGSSRAWVSGDMAPSAILSTTGHEILHNMRTAEGGDDAFRRILKRIGEEINDPETLQSFTQEATKRYPNWEDLAKGIRVEEGITKIVNDAFVNTRIWEEILAEATLHEPLRDAVRKAIKMAGKHLTTQEAEFFKEAVEDMTGIHSGIVREMWHSADKTRAGREGSPEEVFNKSWLGPKGRSKDLSFVESFQKTGDVPEDVPFGTSGRLERIRSKAEDVARGGVKEFAKVADIFARSISRLFQSRKLGTRHRDTQAFAYDVTGMEEDIAPALMLPVMRILDKLHDIGKLEDISVSDKVREAVETGIYHGLSGELEDLQDPARSLHILAKRVYVAGKDAGLKQLELQDYVNWFARKITPELHKTMKDAGLIKGGGKRVDSILSPEKDRMRTELFRNALYGTREFNDITGSKDILSLVRLGESGEAAHLMRKEKRSTIDARIPHRSSESDNRKYAYQQMKPVETVDVDGNTVFYHPEKARAGMAELGDYAGAIEEMDPHILHANYDLQVKSGEELRGMDRTDRVGEFSSPLKARLKDGSISLGQAKRLAIRHGRAGDDGSVSLYARDEYGAEVWRTFKLKDVNYENVDLDDGIEDAIQSLLQWAYDDTEIELVTHITEKNKNLGEAALKTIQSRLTSDTDYPGMKATYARTRIEYPDPKSGTVIVPDRFESMEHYLYENQQMLEMLEEQGGMFREHFAVDLGNRVRREAFRISVAAKVPAALDGMIRTGGLKRGKVGIGQASGRKLGEVWDLVFPHMDKEHVYRKLRKANPEVQIMEEWATKNGYDWMKELDGYLMDRKLFEDLESVGHLRSMPSELEGVAGIFRSGTALFKAGVLTSPDRYGRDIISGQIQNVIADRFSFESGSRAFNILSNQADEALAQIEGMDGAADEFRRIAEEIGLKREAFRKFEVGDSVKVKGGEQGTVSVIESIDVNGDITIRSPSTEEGKTGTVLTTTTDGYEVVGKHGGDWFTPQMAVGVARWEYASMKGSDASRVRDPNLDAAGEIVEESALASAMYGAMPGTSKGGVRKIGRDMLKVLREGSWSPFEIEGVGQYWNVPEGVERGTPRSRSQGSFRDREQKLVAAGNIIQKNFDDMNRMVAWLEGMRKAETAVEAQQAGLSVSQVAFRRATQIQLDYRPKTFGPIERLALKKVFPFYSFVTREAVFLGNELFNNPSGRLGKSIRASHHATLSDEDRGLEGYVPEHYREQMAIPLGESADGGRSYITGLGLMHEDPLSAIAGGLMDPLGAGARDLLSRMNPLIKAPIEHALGVSSFQGGPMGGRRLDQMDPTIGRLMSNLRNMGTPQDEMPRGRADPFISPAFEHYVANSPISRVLNTFKKATDTRRNILQKIPDLVSGVKITTVSPERSRHGVQEMLNKAAKDLGAPMFTKYYLSKALREEVAETDPESAEKMEIIAEILRRMDKERREENKREKASRLERVAQ